MPGVELRLVDELGHDVAADDPGEILVRGANLFSGYWPDGDEAPGRRRLAADRRHRLPRQ